MKFLSNKYKFGIAGAIIVPCFGRLALHGTGSEFDLFRYLVPLLVGSSAGFLIGLMKDKWIKANKELIETNIALNNEILENKSSVKKIIESETRLNSIIENSNAGYFLIDFDGCFKYVNSAWLKLHHYKNKDEIIGEHFSITQVENDLKEANTNVEQLLSGNEIVSGEFSRLCKDGAIGYHNFTARPVYKNKKIVGLEGFLIDVTDKKNIEKEKEKLINDLREALEKIKTLKGLLPICSSCKKIRDDKGYWNSLESYIENYSDAKFSHGICPDCSDKIYSDQDWYIEMKKDEDTK